MPGLPEILDELLAKRLAGIGIVSSLCGSDPCLEIPPGCLAEVAHVLRDHPGAEFDYLACVTGADRHPREPRFEVLYHLRSLKLGHRLALRVAVAGEEPVVPSLHGVWRAAEWQEREIYDLLGLNFTGHPDLRRILLPDDWEGHPLRKDYPLEGTNREALS